MTPSDLPEIATDGAPHGHRRVVAGATFFFAVAAAQGALFGISPLFGGLYDFTAWGALALFSCIVLVALVLTRPVALGLPAAVALSGLGLLLVWSAVSMTWAESVDQAWGEVNRVAFYLVTLAVTVVALRTRGDRRTLLGIVTVGVSLVALYTAGRMLLGSGGSMFLEFRLNEPLGYINGEAGFFLMGFWALVAAAEAPARPLLRGTALGLAVLILALLVLTQSRAVLPALVVSTVVVLAAIPGRRTRAWALVLAVAAAAAALPQLVDVYAQRDGGGAVPTDAVVREAATAALLASVAAGVAWAVASSLAPRLREQLSRRLSTAALVAIALIGAGALVAAVDRPVERVRSEYRAFVSLEVNESGPTRLASAGGFRYDLWGIAARQFVHSPLKGVGVGNYDTTYYRERRNPQPARQPHSLPMQLLGELGLVGGLGLLLLVAGVLLGIARHRSAGARDRWVVVGASGIFIVWLTHTSIDWLWSIPGVTGLALVGAAVLLAPADRSERAPRIATWTSPQRRLALGALAAALALVAASVGRQYAADWYLDRGRSQLSSEPTAALRDAEHALDLNPASLPAHYLAAAAHARRGEYAPARRVLSAATRKEPSDYVPWVLLGDLAVRRGELGLARRDYARASALSPFDTHFSVPESTPPEEGR